MLREKFRTSIYLSIVVIALSIITSAGGIFLETIYKDNEFTKTALYGNDIVTLFLAVPLMILGLFFSIKGSKKALLVWMGTLWYMVYNYIFYLYGTAYNNFFLLYVGLFTLSAYALLFGVVNIDAKGISKLFNEKTPTKLISGYMVFFASLLGGLWIAMSIGSIVSGKIPEHVLQTNHPTAVVWATDLSLLIPALIVSAIYLWKRNPWGYIFSSIVMIKSVTYSIVLIVMSIISYIKMGEGDPFISLWIFLSVTCMIALGLLLGNMK
ncbi:MAG: hypothetical protein HPY60_10870 [Candidatus Methanofastidiosum sp.]|nr:hypothetical protein [Methanofastidiosum sp.]